MLPSCRAPKTTRAAPGGFTLTEVLVSLAVIAVLASILIVALRGARERAQDMESLSDMRQVSIAVLDYAADNRGHLPPLFEKDNWQPRFWTSFVNPYIYGNASPGPSRYAGPIFYCSLVERHHPIGDWGMNSNIAPFSQPNYSIPMARIEASAATAMLFETASGGGTIYDASWYLNVPLAKANPTEWLANRHQGLAFVTFCDGSARQFHHQELSGQWEKMAGPDLR